MRRGAATRCRIRQVSRRSPMADRASVAIHAAAGSGYGQGYAANDHRHVPDAWLHAVKFLVEELQAPT